MSYLLQTIKDQVAKAWYDEHLPGISEENKVFDNLQYIDMNKLWPEVCKRYAFEVAKASLKKASENATMEVRGRVCTKGMTYANHRMEDHTVLITQSSIADDNNIVI